MKNSLFKRAFAAAAAVPLALTQCLGVANAVYVDDAAVSATVKSAAANKTVTLDDGSESAILYIAPGKNEADATDGYIRQGETFVKDSVWNSRVSAILSQIAAGSRRTGTIDATEIFNQAIEKSGRFKEVTKSLTEKISEITYAVADNGDVTIKASLDDITPTFTAGGSNTIGGALKEIADRYGVADLDVPDNFFEDVVIAGDLEVVIYSSSLTDGTSVSGYVKFTDKATGKVYEGSGIIDWALEQFDILKSTAKGACEQYEAYGIDMTDAEKEINDSVSFYVNKLETVKKYAEKALTYDRSISADNVAVIIEKGKDWLAKKNINKTIQGTTASEIASSERAQRIYNNALNQLNNMIQPYSVDITAAELGGFADSVYDITASTSNGVATFTAKFDDAEAEAAKAYIKSAYNVEPTDSYKEVTVTVDFSTVKSGTSSADVQIKRIVEFEPIVTTSTSTSTTVSTSTSTTVADPVTTTSSTVVSGDVTTTSSTAVSGDVTTTSSTVVSGDITTTSSTVVSGDITTTSSTVVSGDITTTSSTDVGGNNTTTSSTATGDPTVTTTKVVREYVVNYTVESDYGFYLNIDREFNKDQIESIAYSVDYSDVYYDADDNVLGQTVITPGDKIDIKSVVEYKDTPASIFESAKDIKIFSHQIPVYASENITAADGTVVALAGDVLKNVDGSNVSVTAYVGVKGDATLDNMVTADDASATLTYYTNLSTGGTAANTVFSTEATLMSNDPLLDEFTAFLCDVDNENDSLNWHKLKPARMITADDASIILTAYTANSTGTVLNRDSWNNILGVSAKVD